MFEIQGLRYTEDQIGGMITGFRECDGVCLECGEITQCEPDARENWCPTCDSQRVVSVLVLAELI